MHIYTYIHIHIYYIYVKVLQPEVLVFGALKLESFFYFFSSLRKVLVFNFKPAINISKL